MRTDANSVAKSSAPIFAALGDETRLSVLLRLSSGEPQSIVRLTSGTSLTRQAMTKHLRVLEAAGLVHSVKAGRETHFAMRREPLDGARAFLDTIAQQWGDALSRLKTFIEGKD
jgi:DNA-binding transcriptional ArsR family regulator